MSSCPDFLRRRDQYGSVSQIDPFLLVLLLPLVMVFITAIETLREEHSWLSLLTAGLGEILPQTPCTAYVFSVE